MTTYYPMEYASSSLSHQPSPSFPHYVPAQYPMSDVMIPPMHRFTSLSSLPDPDSAPTLPPMIPSSPSFSIASHASLNPSSWPSPHTASSSSAASVAVSGSSPYHLPQSHYQSQLYSHPHFSVEIPFAHDGGAGGGGGRAQPELSRSVGSGEASDGDSQPPLQRPGASYSSYSTTSGEGSVESAGDPSPKGKKRRAKGASASSPTVAKQRRTSSPLPSPVALHHALSSTSLTPPLAHAHLSPSELKKVRHREIDAARRAREGAAIGRLHALIGSRSAAATADSAEEKVTDKKDKVGILEVVGDRLVELERMCERLKADLKDERDKHAETTEALAKTSKQMKQLMTNGASPSAASEHSAAADKLAALDPHFQLSPSARAYLAQLETSASLYSLSFVHSSLILLILSVQTGKCVDANQKFCDVAGWTKEEVIGRPFCETAAELFSDAPVADEVACTINKDAPPERTREQLEATSVMGKHSRYACNKAELVALYTGKKTSITVVFRVVLAKGQVIDVRCRCWLGNGHAGSEESGEDPARTATHLIVQTTEEDIIVLS